MQHWVILQHRVIKGEIETHLGRRLAFAFWFTVPGQPNRIPARSGQLR